MATNSWRAVRGAADTMSSRTDLGSGNIYPGGRLEWTCQHFIRLICERAAKTITAESGDGKPIVQAVDAGRHFYLHTHTQTRSEDAELEIGARVVASAGRAWACACPRAR